MTETIGAKYKLEKPVQECVLYEKVEKHIARVTLNRPEKHNAVFPPDMFMEIDAKLKLAEKDDEVKVVILKGAGPSFCTGDDLNRAPYETVGGAPDARPPQSVRLKAMADMWSNTSMHWCCKTLIVQVQGHAMGIGATMVAAADFAIAGESAQFSHPEQRIGFSGLCSSMMRNLLTLGPKREREWLLLTSANRPLTAQKALDWGLVNEVVPDDKLEEETLRWARAVALHPTDGLMIGKFYQKAAFDILGDKAIDDVYPLAWALMTNLKWRDDEFNFLKERLVEGKTGKAFHKREDRWAELGF